MPEIPDLPQYDRTPEGYARMLYGELLDNGAPTEFQVNWWVGKLTSGDPASAVAEFCASDAFASAGYAPEDAAKLLYAAVLGNHEPTEFQVSWWVGIVAADGAASAAAQMCASDAFAAVCEEYGLV